ncbi:MAG: leucyl aminopeptidase family protein [Myxococcales bacterium]|nr:leucyl aminopeptidase family protein [Myxococcales bacterium]
MNPYLRLTDVVTAMTDAQCIIVVGTKALLVEAHVLNRLPLGVREVWPTLVDSLGADDDGDSVTTFVAGPGVTRWVAVALPDQVSRHNCAARPHAISAQIKKHVNKAKKTAILLSLESVDHGEASTFAIARALPIFRVRSGPPQELRTVDVAWLNADVSLQTHAYVTAVTQGIRYAANLVDRPTDSLNTDQFVEEALTVAESVGAKATTIQGRALLDQGFGGLWGVGRAAIHPPALVVLSHEPQPGASSVVWVGKGIVYDTGGLSIKTKTGMVGMKGDMAGAAAVLAAFATAVRTGYAGNLYAVLCIAENAIGPDATRPDDILTLYSGKTVEINNTDAEGRLVLGDGVAYATRHLSPTLIVDLATLTGAQLMATGKRMAAIMSNDSEWESACVRAGKKSGDLTFPIPYCPEFFRREFRSPVADMRNSVKDRMNAQSSCAGQFIAEHLVSYSGVFIHVDMAGPASDDDRGTGYGVALLNEMLRVG